MKTLLLYVSAFCLWMGMLQAQELSIGIPPIGTETPSSDYLNNQWYIGKKDEMYHIAYYRSQKNKDDLIGLLILYDYAMEKMDKALILNITSQVKNTVTKMPNYSLRNELIYSMEWMENVVAATSQEKLAQGSNKVNVNEKPLSKIKYLVALEKEGHLSPLTNAEKSYIEGKINKEEFLKEINAPSLSKTNGALENNGLLNNNQTTHEQKSPALQNKTFTENIPAWVFVLTGVFVLALGYWEFVRLRTK